MVRWAEIDRQGLAAAAESIYEYYHPVCNAGSLHWRHAIMLQWRMTSHQNEMDRWSRHYYCSQNFTLYALFGKENLSHMRSDIRSFKKTVLSSLELMQVTSSYSKAFFLKSWLLTVDACCFNSVSVESAMKNNCMRARRCRARVKTSKTTIFDEHLILQNKQK